MNTRDKQVAILKQTYRTLHHWKCEKDRSEKAAAFHRIEAERLRQEDALECCGFMSRESREIGFQHECQARAKEADEQIVKWQEILDYACQAFGVKIANDGQSVKVIDMSPEEIASLREANTAAANLELKEAIRHEAVRMRESFESFRALVTTLEGVNSER